MDTVAVVPFMITENDTNTYQLKLALDERGNPVYFFRNIFTPVCLTGECKPVYINFYWDLLGNYTHYDMPEGEILTKMDHDEFSEDDYTKLQDILINSSSLLKDVEMEDLISTGTEHLADSVDAKTGATLKSIKKEIIEGAVYTCYTLWHIAYGDVVVGKMRSVTDSLCNETLLHTFLNSPNYHYQYWAMGKVMDNNGKVKPAFLPDVKHIIQGKNIFAARYALQKITSDQTDAGWLWEVYQQSTYAFQLELLKKMEKVPVPENTQQVIAGHLKQGNEVQSGLIIDILEKQPQLSTTTMKTMAGLLKSAPATISDRIYGLLKERNTSDAEVKKQLLAYQQRKQPKP